MTSNRRIGTNANGLLKWRLIVGMGINANGSSKWRRWLGSITWQGLWWGVWGCIFFSLHQHAQCGFNPVFLKARLDTARLIPQHLKQRHRLKATCLVNWRQYSISWTLIDTTPNIDVKVDKYQGAFCTARLLWHPIFGPPRPCWGGFLVVVVVVVAIVVIVVLAPMPMDCWNDV